MKVLESWIGLVALIVIALGGCTDSESQSAPHAAKDHTTDLIIFEVSGMKKTASGAT